MFETWQNRTLASLSPKERKQKERAIQKIEEEFCPNCKLRFEKLVSVVEGTYCMRVFFKVNNGKYRGIRCKKFKRRTCEKEG